MFGGQIVRERSRMPIHDENSCDFCAADAMINWWSYGYRVSGSLCGRHIGEIVTLLHDVDRPDIVVTMTRAGGGRHRGF